MPDSVGLELLLSSSTASDAEGVLSALLTRTRVLLERYESIQDKNSNMTREQAISTDTDGISFEWGLLNPVLVRIVHGEKHVPVQEALDELVFPVVDVLTRCLRVLYARFVSLVPSLEESTHQADQAVIIREVCKEIRDVYYTIQLLGLLCNAREVVMASLDALSIATSPAYSAAKHSVLPMAFLQVPTALPSHPPVTSSMSPSSPTSLLGAIGTILSRFHRRRATMLQESIVPAIISLVGSHPLDITSAGGYGIVTSMLDLVSGIMGSYATTGVTLPVYQGRVPEPVNDEQRRILLRLVYEILSLVTPSSIAQLVTRLYRRELASECPLSLHDACVLVTRLQETLGRVGGFASTQYTMEIGEEVSQRTIDHDTSETSDTRIDLGLGYSVLLGAGLIDLGTLAEPSMSNNGTDISHSIPSPSLSFLPCVLSPIYRVSLLLPVVHTLFNTQRDGEWSPTCLPALALQLLRHIMYPLVSQGVETRDERRIKYKYKVTMIAQAEERAALQDRLADGTASGGEGGDPASTEVDPVLIQADPDLQISTLHCFREVCIDLALYISQCPDQEQRHRSYTFLLSLFPLTDIETKLRILLDIIAFGPRVSGLASLCLGHVKDSLQWVLWARDESITHEARSSMIWVPQGVKGLIQRLQPRLLSMLHAVLSPPSTGILASYDLLAGGYNLVYFLLCKDKEHNYLGLRDQAQLKLITGFIKTLQGLITSQQNQLESGNDPSQGTVSSPGFEMSVATPSGPVSLPASTLTSGNDMSLVRMHKLNQLGMLQVTITRVLECI